MYKFSVLWQRRISAQEMCNVELGSTSFSNNLKYQI